VRTLASPHALSGGRRNRELSRDEAPQSLRQLRAIASNQLSSHMAGEHPDVKVMHVVVSLHCSSTKPI
jgi:hypothetical protein